MKLYSLYAYESKVSVCACVIINCKTVITMPSSKERRSVGLFSPGHCRAQKHSAQDDCDRGSTNNALSDVPMNDDDAEKLQRKQEKVLEMHLQSSPVRSNRRKSSLSQSSTSIISGMTSAQLAEQYANCIKLSTENKITIKNAFGLHLIDYMALMLKKKDPDMNNLPMASVTLDASTKIYGYRVDCVHADTCKMFSGLSRSNKMQNMQNELQDDAPDSGRKNTKKKREKSRTIEQNIKALNMNKMDLQFEVDPFFQKTTEMFAEMALSGGYLLSILRSRDDSCELLLDTSTIRNSTSINIENMKNSWVNLSELQSLFAEENFESRKICPEFSDFEFGTWNLDDNLQYQSCMAQDEVASMAQEMTNTSGGNIDCSVDNDVRNDAGEDVLGHSGTNAEQHLCDLGETLSKSCYPPVSLFQALASEPNEYSYFDERLLIAWAGPLHWRPFPRLRDKKTEEDAKESKTRAKKVAFRINYSNEVNFKKEFKSSKSEIQLTKNTLKQWTIESTTLPDDLHYKPLRLLQLFLKPSTMVYGKKITTNENPDESISDYNYNNDNDMENFVPPAQGADGLLSPSPPHSPFTSDEFSVNNHQSFQATFAYTGDNLVPEPRKVAKFHIPHVRAAKKINVKHLKTSIWKLLTAAEKPVEAPDNHSHVNDDDDDISIHSMVTEVKSFIDLYQQLHESLPNKIATDLSQHIAFICILHLANEKNLHLVGQQDMQDFHICQGTFSEYIKT